MAITVVQGRGLVETASSTTIARAFTSAVTSGNTIIVIGMHSSATNYDVTGVTDSAGNTYYERATGDLENADTIKIYEAYNVTGAASLTVTVSYEAAVTYRKFLMLEVSGLVNTGAYDTAALPAGGSRAGSVAPDGDYSNDITPSVDGCLIVGGITVAAQDASMSVAAGTNFTESYSWEPGNCTQIEYYVQPSAATISAKWTAGDTDSYWWAVASFKPEGSSPVWTSNARIIYTSRSDGTTS